MEDRQKRIIVILMVLTIIFTISGGTLAYWTWTSGEAQKTAVTFTATKDFACAADGGGNISEQDAFIAPTSCTNSEHAIQREVTVTPTLNRNDLTISMDLWLNVIQMGTSLSNSQNFRYALTTDSSSCENGVISSGTFNGKTAGHKVNLFEKVEYSSETPQKYYLYIWLDGAETSSSTMNQSFILALGGNCTDNVMAPQPEAPVLDAGMIPVKIANNGAVTTVSETDPSWYNYDNKEWANVVLVDSDSRSTYKGTAGTTINQDDILAYYVWIPRYSYKIPPVGTTTTCSELSNPGGYLQCYGTPYTVSDYDKERMISFYYYYKDYCDPDDYMKADYSYSDIVNSEINTALQTGYFTDGTSINDFITSINDPEREIGSCGYDPESVFFGNKITLNKTFFPNVSVIQKEKAIDIKFESKDNAVVTGDAVNQYRTHPAFTFGDENVAGIWVGKFDTSENYDNGYKLIVLPNFTPWYGNFTISDIFSDLLTFSGGVYDFEDTGAVTFSGNNTYGLTANVDSHMMKNSEYGAIVYLSHSKYGINTKIEGANTYYEEAESDTGMLAVTGSGYSGNYGTLTTYPQSTTGNISGVFDMGSGNKMMMAFLAFDFYSPDMAINLYTNAKYYDIYENPYVDKGYGDVMSETTGWYGSSLNPYINSLIITRYNQFFVSSTDEPFSENPMQPYYSFRSILINMNG